MKRSFTCIAIVFFCVSLCASVTHSAEKVMRMEWSHFLPATDPGALLTEEWAKEMEKDTNGRLKFTIHPASILTPPSQAFDSTVQGIVDVGQAGTGITPGRFPVLEVMDLPWGTRYAVTSTALANDLINKFKPKEFEKVKILQILSQGPMLIHTNKPVRSLEDLKGLKLRVPGGLSVDIVKALGAVPLVISPGETYDALQKGVADGVVCGMQGLDIFRFGEVTKYTVLNYRTGIGVSGFVVMNIDKWNSLSADEKKAFDKLSTKYTEKFAQLFDKTDMDAKVGWEKKNGHQYITLSKEEEDRWAAKIAPLYDKYVTDRSGKGVPAAEALQFCKDWVKKKVK
jgi:TRAP-type C4-dicarboxylate transport system substrate-binding protein